MIRNSFIAILAVLLCCSTGYPSTFVDNGNGTVSDGETELLWQQIGDETGKNWQQALDYCNELDFRDYTDWRLPDVKELNSLIVHSKKYPSTETSVFGWDDNRYWTSTTNDQDPRLAWVVSFFAGEIDFSLKTNTYNKGVRCVR